LIVPTVVGINLIVIALLYWNTARNDRSQEQSHRLESHRREAESDGKLE
jgi:hypothetical protein